MKSDDRAALGRKFASMPVVAMRNTVAAARAPAAAMKITALNMSLFKRGTQHAHMASQDRDKSCMEYREVGTCSRPCISPGFLHAVQTRMPVEVEVKDRRWGLLLVHKSCFTGALAVDWLKKNGFVVDDVDAMLVCNFLLHSGFFVPVEDSSDVMGAGVVLDVILGERGSDQFRNSEGVFYRFGKAKFECSEGMQYPPVPVSTKTSNGKELLNRDICGVELLTDEELLLITQEVNESLGESLNYSLSNSNTEDLLDGFERKPMAAGRPSQDLGGSDYPPPGSQSLVMPFMLHMAGAAVDVVSQLAGTGSMAGHVLMVLTLGVLLSTLTAWPLTVWLLLMPAAMLYMRCVETNYVQGVQSLVQSQMWRAILMATTDRDNAEVCRWFNRLLTAMWNGWIAPWLNRMIKSQISAKLGLLDPPGIENIELAEFKLGSIPPYFKTVRVYPGTTDKETMLEIDTHLRTTDLSIHFLAHLTTLGIPLNIYLSDLEIQGKIRLVFTYLPFSPYIKALRVAFLSMPKYRLKVTPMSKAKATNVLELPIIDKWVKNQLDNFFDKNLVEPNPFVWNIERWWWDAHRCSHLCVHRDPINLRRGEAFHPSKDTRPNVRDLPLGWLELVVVTAENLEKPFHYLGHMNPYVKVTQNAVTLKTHCSSNCNWQAHFSFVVREWARDSKLKFEVMDRNLMERHSLGYIMVDARDFMDGQVHELNMPLAKATSGTIRLRLLVVAPAWDTLTQRMVPAVTTDGYAFPDSELEHQRQMQTMLAVSDGWDKDKDKINKRKLSTRSSHAEKPSMLRCASMSAKRLGSDRIPEHLEGSTHSSSVAASSLKDFPIKEASTLTESSMTLPQKKHAASMLSASDGRPSNDLTPCVLNREPLPSLQRVQSSSAIEYAHGDAYGKAAALARLETSPWRRQQGGGECVGLANSPDILLRQDSLAPWCGQVKAGWLTKKSQTRMGSLRTWKRRFFMLGHHETDSKQLSLRYYASNTCKTNVLRGEMTLRAGACVRVQHEVSKKEARCVHKSTSTSKGKIRFAVLQVGASEVLAGRELTKSQYKGALILDADSVRDMEEWKTAVEGALESLIRAQKESEATLEHPLPLTRTPASSVLRPCASPVTVQPSRQCSRPISTGSSQDGYSSTSEIMEAGDQETHLISSQRHSSGTSSPEEAPGPASKASSMSGPFSMYRQPLRDNPLYAD